MREVAGTTAQHAGRNDSRFRPCRLRNLSVHSGEHLEDYLGVLILPKEDLGSGVIDPQAGFAYFVQALTIRVPSLRFSFMAFTCRAAV